MALLILSLMKLMNLWRLSCVPVSYTHLDVYKRQPEYVIGDMISPFKSVVGGGYKDVEARLQVAIHQRFGLPPKLTEALKKEIKRADQVAAYFEATELAGFTHAEAAQYFSRPRWISPEKLELEPKPAKAVEAGFLKRFKAIQVLSLIHI